jgi:hypothetical protein
VATPAFRAKALLALVAATLRRLVKAQLLHLDLQIAPIMRAGRCEVFYGQNSL